MLKKVRIVEDTITRENERVISILLIGNYRVLMNILSQHKNLSVTYTNYSEMEYDDVRKQVKDNPYIPEFFHDKEELIISNEETVKDLLKYYKNSIQEALSSTYKLYNCNYKNRYDENTSNSILSPYMKVQMLITGKDSDWSRFCSDYCPKYGLFSENMPIDFQNKESLKEYMLAVGDDIEEVEKLTELQWLSEVNRNKINYLFLQLGEEVSLAIKHSKPRNLDRDEVHIPFKNQPLNVKDRT